MNGSKKILLSWVGRTDLDAFQGKKGNEPGPIRTLLACLSFDEVHLLSNYDREESFEFTEALGDSVKLHMVPKLDPTNYLSLFELVNKLLHTLTSKAANQGAELSIHLSSGTPAMTAISVLLGKSRYPARFFQTYSLAAQKFTKTPYREETIPFDLAVDFVSEVLENADQRLQHLTARSPSEIRGFEQIVGNSEALRLAVGRARRAALRSVPVLLNGESGTGKEMFARAMHLSSPRRKKKFIAINCAAMPRDLLEAELFGHEKGAFTGADKTKKGAFEQAHEGTLFLDEVGECDLAMQAKLLRVLQPPHGESLSARYVRRVGGVKDIKVDVRVISATNKDLMEEVNANKFREDLYYRLAVITVMLPPLRERKGDVAELAASFLMQINKQFVAEDRSFKDRRLSAKAKNFFDRHPWPGNVRQLYNTLLQAAVMSSGPVIQEYEISEALGASRVSSPGDGVLHRPLDEGFDIDKVLDEVRAHYFLRAMEQAGGKKKKAATLLGLNNYQTLTNQMKNLGLES